MDLFCFFHHNFGGGGRGWGGRGIQLSPGLPYREIWAIKIILNGFFKKHNKPTLQFLVEVHGGRCGWGKRVQLPGCSVLANAAVSRDSWVEAACPRVPPSPVLPILPIAPQARAAPRAAPRGPSSAPRSLPSAQPGPGVPPVGSSRRGTGGPGQPSLPSPPN